MFALTQGSQNVNVLFRLTRVEQMKAAAFDYIRPDTLEAVLEALDRVGDEGRIIAGGQTLVPMMAMRLVKAELLIDINHIQTLAGIHLSNESLSIRACTRQAEAAASEKIINKLPLLAKALEHVGHTQTRNRGTVGGSIANADPSAEIPIVARCLDAKIVALKKDGERQICAGNFFYSAMDTALEDTECLTEVRFSIWSEEVVGSGFHEVSIRNSDYALVAVAAQLATDFGGKCTRAAVAVGGCAPAAVKIDAVEKALVGKPLSDAAFNEACGLVVEALDPDTDVHATAEYRKRVAGRIVRRVLEEARAEVYEARNE